MNSTTIRRVNNKKAIIGDPSFQDNGVDIGYSTIFGFGNTVGSDATNVFMTGISNVATGSNSSVGGNNSEVSNPGSIVHGIGLKDTEPASAVFGSYNKINIDANKHIKFDIGDGTVDERSSCFSAGYMDLTNEKFMQIGETELTESKLQEIIEGGGGIQVDIVNHILYFT